MRETTTITRHGSVRGVDADGCVSFLGIPFTRPPLGPLRFRPPTDPEPWSGVLEATTPGLVAPQAESMLAGYVPGDPLEQGEDCLTLNVFTPALDDARRPVLVYVHGGAFLIGTGAGVMYRGEHFALGGVVLVTFNYRLGALGFLAHPDLDLHGGAGFGNWGLADQLAALRWVREHVAVFGGDPSNVTIFGESAGAMSAADLLGAPAASGLFRRAILESGSTLARSAESAASVVERFCGALGLPGVDRARLEQVPVAELLGAQASLLGGLGSGGSMPFQPVVDGALLPWHPEAAIAAGKTNAESLLIGTNRDEFRLFTIGQPQLGTLEEADLEGLVRAYLPEDGTVDAKVLIATYRSARDARGQSRTRRELFEAIAGDALFSVPAMRLAASHATLTPTYCYRFDWESPFGGLGLGACHGLELPFVFGTVTNPIIGLFSGSSPEAVALSETMRSSWIAFATSGNPQVEATGPWPSYDADRRATLILGPEVHLEDAPTEEERRYWEASLGRYGRTGEVAGERPKGT